MGALRRAGVPLRRGVSGVRVIGTGRAEGVEYRWRGAVHSEPADLVLLHQGVVPNGNLAWSLRCAHDWNDAQRCFTPRLDEWGATSVEGIRIAGDAGGIVGARASEYAGRLAAFAAACDGGRISATECDARA